MTAALLNTHLRDNMAETGPPKIPTLGDMVYSLGGNSPLAALAIGAAYAQLRVNSGATAPQWAVAPSCQATRAGTQALTAPFNSALAFDGENWDNDTMHDPSSNNSRITCKTAGVFIVHAACTGNPPFTTGSLSFVFKKNGSALPGGLIASGNAGDLVHVAKLAVNDYVEFFAVDATNNQTVAASPVFSAAWVGPG